MDDLFEYLQANDAQLWANYCALSQEWRNRLTYPAYCVAQYVKLRQLREWRENMPDGRSIQLN